MRYLIISLFLPMPLLAAEIQFLDFDKFKGEGPTALLGIFDTFINWLFTILLVLAVIFILIAAFKYLTSSTKPEEISKAHKMLIYAGVAIAVALLAGSLRFIVEQLVGGSPSAPPAYLPTSDEDARSF